MDTNAKEHRDEFKDFDIFYDCGMTANQYVDENSRYIHGSLALVEGLS